MIAGRLLGLPAIIKRQNQTNMKQRIQLQIPEPCHENWDKMTSTQQGRFCMSCQKEVVDFSVMSDKDILNYISTASTNMCGRVTHDQLNRDLLSPPEPRKIWWRYWMSAAASIMLLSSRSNAQGKVSGQGIVIQPSSSKTVRPIILGYAATIKTNDEIKIQIQGRVVDEKNNPVSYASIRLAGSSSGVSADSTGCFTMNAKSDISNIELTVSAVGYQQKKIQVDEPANIKSATVENGVFRLGIRDILLTMSSLGEVTVTGYATQGLYAVVGGVSVCRRVTRYERVKAAFKDVLSANEIKIYPNPVAANTTFNISFNIKEMGEYAVQFTDASGKIVATQQLNIVAKNQLESFNGNMFRGSGIYFVSLTGKQKTKVYTAKLLIQ